MSRLPRPAAAPSVSLPRYFLFKPWAERLFVLLLIIPASVVIGVCAFAVWLTSGRPVFFRQQRVGRHGKPYSILKLRTMCKNAEASTGPVWCASGDARVTLVGRVLRATHLDELPQLFNVLTGHMNLIGPRPERPAIVERLLREVPGYEDRCAVLPGITGLAQIHQRSDRDISDVRQKLRYDMVYIRRACLPMDLWILWRTIPHLLGFSAKRSPSSRKSLHIIRPLTHSSHYPEGGVTLGETPLLIENALLDAKRA